MLKDIKKLLLLGLIFIGCFGAFAEDEDVALPTDTFFTNNIQLSSIVYTNKGWVIIYHNGHRMKETYIPLSFADQGKVKFVTTTTPGEALQANVVYKNGKAYKVKIYTNPTAQGRPYVVRDKLTATMKEKFDNTEELEF